MGGTSSKTTSDVLTDLSIDVTQSVIANCVSTATASQIISARNVAGDVTISGVNLTQSASVDMTCVMSSQMQSDIMTSISDAIAQYAETNGIALLSALGSTKSTAESAIQEILNESVSQSSEQNAEMMTLLEQTVEAVDIGGNVIIEDITMDQTIEMVARAIIESTAYASSITEIANAIEQTGYSTETGPLDTLFNAIASTVSAWMILVLGLAIVGAVVLIFAMKYIFTSDVGMTLASTGADIAKSQLGGVGAWSV